MVTQSKKTTDTEEIKDRSTTKEKSRDRSKNLDESQKVEIFNRLSGNTLDFSVSYSAAYIDISNEKTRYTI